MNFLSQKYINFIELTDIGKILKISDYFISINNINKNNIEKTNIINKNSEKYLDNKGNYMNDERIGLKAALEYDNYENGDFNI